VDGCESLVKFWTIIDLRSSLIHVFQLKFGLDYDKEVHQSRISGEWSNLIGYEMGFSPAKVYTTPKTLCMDEKNDMDANMATIFC
jgi:hypothetical protein